MLNELDVKPYIYMRACMRRENRVFIQLNFRSPFVFRCGNRWSEFDLPIKARDNRVIDRAPL